MAISTAQTAEVIQWYAGDFPPGIILRGRDQGKGYLDQIMKVIQEGLPEYEHRIVIAAPVRISHDITVYPNVCIAGATYSAERAQSRVFSDVIFSFLPSGLLIRADKLASLRSLMDEEGRVSLRQFIQSNIGRIGVMNQRIYGGTVDPLLNSEGAQLERIDLASGDDALAMRVALGRNLDAALTYGFEITWLGRQDAETASMLRWLPVQEEPDVMASRISCSKSAFGERIVERMNRVIRTAGNSERFQRFYEGWLDDDSAQRLRKLIKASGKARK
ncbi:TIGR02285 family protein [Burkholderiaceae bacterium DAT-1]|nr:TIGR02285 family protein [Burkholderiaceae bacterium DAT-1]